MKFRVVLIASFLTAFGIGACAPDAGDSCIPGSLNCVCNYGACLATLECVAGYCVFGDGTASTGDGDETGDQTGDETGGCGAGEIACDGTCVDPDSDPQHCGDCDVACAGACVDGACAELDCTMMPCPDGSYCDPDTNQCALGCDSDDDCMEGACDLATNTCGLEEGDACDPYAQDCLSGLKCDVGEDPPVCVELPPDPKGIGEACSTTDDDCDAGGVCRSIGEPGVGKCYPLCSGSADEPICESNDRICISSVNPHLCLYGCDPLLQDCGAGEGCYPIADQEVFVCVWASQNTPLGEPCGFINDCAPGLGCYDNCAEFCEVANPPVDCNCDELFAGIGLCG